MSLISLIIALALVGFVLWLVLTYIPMPEPFKKVMLVVVILVMVLWLLQVFGVPGLTVPRFDR